MTPVFKGILWIALVVGLWGLLAPKARAESEERLNELISDKYVIYVGTCNVGANGDLVFPPAPPKVALKCIVGIGLDDEQKHYVLLYVNDRAARLVLFDKVAGTQTQLWRAGKET